MRSRDCLLTVLLLCMHAALLSGVATAAPSKALQVVLDSRLPAVCDDPGYPSDKVHDLIWQVGKAQPEMRLKVGLEYEGGKVKQREKIALPEGTVRQQLDKIADSGGFNWEANEDWINLVPKERAKDPAYIMNKRIPGKVVLSRNASVATSVRDWFRANGVVTAQLVHDITVKLPQEFSQPTPDRTKTAPDPIILRDPTLREYWNAFGTLYGEEVWTLQVTQVPSADGKSPARTMLVTWSRGARPSAQNQASKQPVP